MKRSFLITSLILTAGALMAQSTRPTTGGGWTLNPYENKAFIENKGQFNGKDEVKGSQVYYGVENLGLQIYYSNKGFTYRSDELVPEEKGWSAAIHGLFGRSKQEGEEKELEERLVLKTKTFGMEWLGSNPAVVVKPEGKLPSYSCYNIDGDPKNAINNVPGYEKLVYKNLYPGIDVIYTFHEKEGMKYALVVHPGADISKVKMKWNDASAIAIDASGNLKMQSSMGNFTDHAPVSFYELSRGPVRSAFVLDGNTVSFQLDNYDKSKTLIIDPWTTNPNFTPTNKAWDVEHDAPGNVYVYGAPMPHQLKKFNTAGVLQWTYNTGFTSYPGDLGVDQNGNSYITQSLNGICAKVNNAGGLTWQVAGVYREYWTISIDCSGSKLVIAESYPGTFMSNVNPTTGAISGTTNISPGGQDARAMCVAPNGNYYIITADYASNERLIGVTPAWATVLNVTAIHDPPYNATPLYQTNFIHGYNGITCDTKYLYTNRGATIYKRNITTGATVATAAVPGGTDDANCGIAVDGCGNVYVGSTNAVIKYDSNLTFVTSQPSAAVYDVTIGNTGEIYACGLAFVSSLNFNACYPSLITFNVNAINAGCGGGTGSASVSAVSGGINPYTYSWSPTGGTNAVATGLTSGIYTVTITDATGCKFGVKTVAITSGGGSLTLSSTQNNVSCNGGNNGTATVSSSTGTSPYTYSWNPTGQNTQTATGLTAGTYTVTVTDATGCSSTVQVTLTQPPAMTAGISTSVNVNCNGGNNGSATATASGGTGTITYTWNNGQVSSTATGLTAGTYTVTAKDANGCTQTATVLITQPTLLLTGVSVSTTVSCNGGNNGSITATASGGTAGYSFSWNNGQATANATGLTAGTYTVTTTDSKGCTATATFTVTQPTALVVNGSATTATCGASNGTATATGSGGTAGYTYSWNNGQLTQTATGLGAGTYTVTVTDNKGCTKTFSIAVNNAGSPTAGISTKTNVLCFGGNNGSATATATGGTGTLTYSWSNGQTGASATGLTAGTYTITVTDQNGCSAFATVIITQPTQLTAGISGWSNPNCSGGSNGTASATASGGTGSITYSWSTGATGGSVTGLTAGTYTVTSVDANNCTQMATLVVSQPTALVVGISTQTNISCNGGNNGSATATSTGGSGGTQYVWSTGQSAATATGLTAGTYTVTATDVNGCTRTTTVTITQPSTINLLTSTVNSTCGQANGTATVTASGGTGAFTYSWSFGSQTTQTATGLAANTYTVLVTDANGCTKTATVTVVNAGSPTVGISTQTNVSCFGGNNGTATATASGGTGTLTYSWTPSGGTGSTGTGMTAGTYTITVTDQNGCSATATVTITQPTQLTAAAATGANVSCTGGNNGSAGVTAAGGTVNYTYSWNNGQATATATGLTAGTYTVTVTDSKGCTATATAAITQPAQLTAGISAQVNVSCNGGSNGTATVTAAGGVANYTFLWSNTQNTSTATSLTAGTYTVTVTDANNCTATATVTITQPAALTLQTSFVSSTCSQANGTATVTANGGTGSYTYSWNNTQTTQTATGLLAGAYTVTVTDANNCTATATVNVTNAGSPSIGITTSGNVSCFGGNNGTATATSSGGTGTLTYSWSPNGGTTLNGTGLSAGTYTVNVIDQNGCTATATVNITQPAVLTVNASGTSGCAGIAATASCTAGGGTTGYNYAWSNGQTTQTATGLSTGVYTVTVSDANNCIATATAQVTINPLPVVVISADDTSGCEPLCVNFTCTTANITNWSWDFGDGNTSILQNPNHCFKSSGSYDIKITITDNNGCTNTLTKKGWITVFPNPVADFIASPQPTTVLNSTITFTDKSTGANTWSWNFGESSSGSSNTSSLQNPVHMYKDSGKYSVTLWVWNTFGCKDSIIKDVIILGDYILYAPNSFTPNGDGLNDVWNVKGIGIDPENFELFIFDRWGNLIFHTQELNRGWNGHANYGKEIAQQDVYVWKVFTRDFLGGKHSYIGHVSLVR